MVFIITFHIHFTAIETEAQEEYGFIQGHPDVVLMEQQQIGRWPELHLMLLKMHLLNGEHRSL